VGLDGVEIIVRVEKTFDIQIPDSVVAKIWTPRDLVEHISGVIELQSATRCETTRVFYALRRQFPEARAFFKPSTRTRQIAKAQEWQQAWNAVREELASSAPARLPGGIFGLEHRTVRELVFWVAEENCARTKIEFLTREIVALKIRRIIFEVIGARGFSLDAQFVRDLGLN
jgi:hypothetical protein